MFSKEEFQKDLNNSNFYNAFKLSGLFINVEKQKSLKNHSWF